MAVFGAVYAGYIGARLVPGQLVKFGWRVCRTSLYGLGDMPFFIRP